MAKDISFKLNCEEAYCGFCRFIQMTPHHYTLRYCSLFEEQIAVNPDGQKSRCEKCRAAELPEAPPEAVSFANKREILGEINEDIVLFDGYEEALVGVGTRFGQSPVAVYDYDKCLEILQKRDGMSYEDASEYFDVNTLGSWVGENTPSFIQFFGAIPGGEPL